MSLELEGDCLDQSHTLRQGSIKTEAYDSRGCYYPSPSQTDMSCELETQVEVQASTPVYRFSYSSQSGGVPTKMSPMPTAVESETFSQHGLDPMGLHPSEQVCTGTMPVYKQQEVQMQGGPWYGNTFYAVDMNSQPNHFDPVVHSASGIITPQQLENYDPRQPQSMTPLSMHSYDNSVDETSYSDMSSETASWDPSQGSDAQPYYDHATQSMMNVRSASMSVDLPYPGQVTYPSQLLHYNGSSGGGTPHLYNNQAPTPHHQPMECFHPTHRPAQTQSTFRREMPWNPPPRSKATGHRTSKLKGETSPRGHRIAGDRIECDKCGKSFTRAFNYRAHQDTHLPDRKRPFPCEFATCPKGFYRPADLKRHLRSVHYKSKDFTCRRCGAGFPRKDSLARHVIAGCTYGKSKTSDADQRRIKIETTDSDRLGEDNEDPNPGVQDPVRRSRTDVGDPRRKYSKRTRP